MRAERIKLLEENIEEHLNELGIRKEFFISTPKSLIIKFFNC